MSEEEAAIPRDGDDVQEWNGLASSMRALSNAKRLHLVRFLADARSAEEIASELGIARQTALEHLRQLEECGLVERRPARGAHGPVMEYLVSPRRLFAIYEAIGRLGTFENEPGPDARYPTERLGHERAAAGDPAVARLVVVHGVRMGRQVPLRGEGPWLMGRDPRADFPVEYDPFVSTRHAEIRRAPQGFAVVDALSSNGTIVDGLRIPRGGHVPADNGTIITIGRTTVVLRTK